jgi:hypothetical protein
LILRESKPIVTELVAIRLQGLTPSSTLVCGALTTRALDFEGLFSIIKHI